MQRVVWTREIDVDLTRRYVEGQDVAQIAAFLGCNESMVRSRLSTLGIRRRKVKADIPPNGNATWLIGEALRAAIPVNTEDFGQDLLFRLD